jgi:hypothetical protein
MGRHPKPSTNCDIVGCLRHGSSTPESGNSLALQYLSQGATFRLMHRNIIGEAHTEGGGMLRWK